MSFCCCCAEWGYIVASTQVLTIEQIYHTRIHPLHHSPLSYPPPITGIVSTGIIFPFTYTCTQHYIYPPISFPHLFPLPTGTNYPPRRTCSALLFSDFVNKKQKNDVFICLRWLCRKFPCDMSVYVCLITWIGSYPLFFLFLP
jgi:hypothetical protein